jgi:CheY-like chemotaxis protein
LSPRNNSSNLSLPILEFAIDKSSGCSSSTETTKHEISPCLSIEPLHVLIADDSVIARKMVERVLVSTIGAVVSHASNGYEAIDLITKAMENVSNRQHTAKQNHIEEDDDTKAVILWDDVRGSTKSPGGGPGPEQCVADTDNEPGVVLNQSIENWMHSTNLDPSIASTPSGVDDRSTPDNQNFQSLNDSSPFHPPVVDVILMDYHMPGMDGPETIARLRTLGYEGCILALSAIVDAVDRRALLNAGANGVLQKPFRVELFIDTVYGTSETGVVFVVV